ncbi:hypothetical protein CsSME_00012124 [Camellia sinensis var. sinensis]
MQFSGEDNTVPSLKLKTKSQKLERYERALYFQLLSCVFLQSVCCVVVWCSAVPI